MRSGLIAVNSELGEARVGIDELLRASLRMRPDRLMVGEIRGAEAFTFLRAVNTGHPGFADDGARGQSAGGDGPDCVHDAAGRAHADADRRDRLCASVIDVVVQLSRTSGKRGVSQVVLPALARGRNRTPEKPAPATGAGENSLSRGAVRSRSLGVETGARNDRCSDARQTYGGGEEADIAVGEVGDVREDRRRPGCR